MSVFVVATDPAQARALVRWGLRFACGLGDPRVTVCFIGEENKETKTLKPQLRQDAADLCRRELKIKFASVTSQDSDAITEFIEAAQPRLLVVASQSRSSTAADELSKLPRSLFQRCRCDTLLIRLGEHDGSVCKRILVPCSGGRHSRAALRVAHGAIQGEGATVTPLYVEPDVDEVAEDVGKRILSRIISRAGLDTHDARLIPTVIVDDQIDRGIRKVAAQGDFDLVLVGASAVGSMRRKLFSVIPEKLLQGNGDQRGMAIGTIRHRHPMGKRFMDGFERILRLTIPQLHREERIAVFEKLQSNSQWNFDFMTLICLSTAIAALGLLQNSTAVVIGAMLVAPLMTPILASGLALVQGNTPLIKASIRSILFGFLFALCIGLILGGLDRLLAGSSSLTAELESRGQPNARDVFIALFSGIAASYCIARPNLASALAGVAIAAALVPPIATTGISIAYNELGHASGSSLLFGINVVAIIFGATITFYGAGIRGNDHFSKKQLWEHRGLVILLILLVGALMPIALHLLEYYQREP